MGAAARSRPCPQGPARSAPGVALGRRHPRRPNVLPVSLQEGANINKSLTTLGKVISALAEMVSGFGFLEPGRRVGPWGPPWPACGVRAACHVLWRRSWASKESPEMLGVRHGVQME